MEMKIDDNLIKRLKKFCKKEDIDFDDNEDLINKFIEQNLEAINY